MSNNTNITEPKYKEIPLFFCRALGYTLYGKAVAGTPYDTGNIVHSISLKINTPTHIQIIFPASKAYYTDLLEEGTSNHGKHKGFISEGIVPNMISEIKDYFSGVSMLFPGTFNKRAFLSQTAKRRGYGKGKVTVGRSRYNKDTRAIRRQRSLRSFGGG